MTWLMNEAKIRSMKATGPRWVKAGESAAVEGMIAR